jgi:hypothetical protein
MVPSISKFDLGVRKFRPAARSMKLKADRPQKLTAEWQLICYFHTKFGVDLIKATQKIRVSFTTYIYHNITLTFDLDLEMVPSMKFLPL